MLPAVGQGVIGIECRDDAGIRELLRPLEHSPTRSCLDAERAFSARLGGSCQSPIAAYAELEGGRLRLRGLVGSPDGTKECFDVIEGPADLAASLGTQLGERVLAAGAGALLCALAAGAGS
jgi:hydroxymethylbilane synthase